MHGHTLAFFSVKSHSFGLKLVSSLFNQQLFKCVIYVFFCLCRMLKTKLVNTASVCLHRSSLTSVTSVIHVLLVQYFFNLNDFIFLLFYLEYKKTQSAFITYFHKAFGH